MPVLQVDAHFTLIEASLKGYAKWKKLHQHDNVRGREGPQFHLAMLTDFLHSHNRLPSLSPALKNGALGSWR